jgi:hypothetical protein
MYDINVTKNHLKKIKNLKVVYKVEWNHILTLWNIYHNLENSQVLNFPYSSFTWSITSKQRSVDQLSIVQRKN